MAQPNRLQTLIPHGVELPWVQGPLAGYSHAAFRRLLWRQEGPLPRYSCTEMLPASVMVRENGAINRYTARAAEEQRLVYQLSGHDPTTLARATQLVAAMGADGIDLNLGCPKPKVRRKGAGSAMMDNLEALEAVLRAMRAATELPLSVKTRIFPGPSPLEPMQRLRDSLVRSGCDVWVIHARAWFDDYDVDPFQHAEVIADLCATSDMPIVWSGNITCPADVHRVTALGCKAAMVGRQGFLAPWLMSGAMPSLPEVGGLVIELLEGLAALDSLRVMQLESHSIIRHYAKWLPEDVKTSFVASWTSSMTLDAMAEHIQQAFRAEPSNPSCYRA